MVVVYYVRCSYTQCICVLRYGERRYVRIGGMVVVYYVRCSFTQCICVLRYGERGCNDMLFCYTVFVVLSFLFVVD